MKLTKKLPAILFCAALVLFAALYLLLPKQTFSQMEKRVLAEAPELTVANVLDGSFTEQTQDWMNDHIPFRDVMVGLSAYTSLAEGQNGLDGVLTANGRLYGAASQPDYAAVRTSCERIAAFAQSTGLPADVMLIPDAGYMAEETLPLHEAYADADVVARTRELLPDGIGFFFPEDELRGGDTYYRTDHHYTSEGAYRSAQVYLASLGMELPGRSAYTVETVPGFFGSMGSRSGLWLTEPDTLELWHGADAEAYTVSFDEGELRTGLFFPEHLDTADKYSAFLDGNHPLAVIDTGRTGGGTLLVVRDSFGHCMAPFLADVFDRVVLVDMRYYRKSVSELAQRYGAERVLFLYGMDTWVTGRDLAFLK